jgi:hypothetical protein
MGMCRMHGSRKKSDHRQGLGFGDRVARPKVEALAQIRQNRAKFSVGKSAT